MKAGVKRKRKLSVWNWNVLLAVVVINNLFFHATNAVPQDSPTQDSKNLCRVQNGLSSVIVDIVESRDDQVDQVTRPRALPIMGNPETEIELNLVYPPENKKYFRLSGNELKLNEPLDRDKDDISSLVFQAVCSVRGTEEKRTIPIIVRVSDLNDNSPLFSQSSYETSVPESTPVGTIVFKDIGATDADAGVNGLIQYSIAKDEEGGEFFAIKSPHLGVVTLNRTLDFERSDTHYVTILAMDRAFDSKLRRTSTATLTVNVIDSDDQGPRFLNSGCEKIELSLTCLNPEYNATVTRGVLSGVLDIRPERIQAVDSDTIRSPISYSFVTGSPPTYLDYFHIDSNTGTVRQVRPVTNDEEIKFNIIVRAVEQSESRKFATAQLTISVTAEDKNLPILHASSLIGFVPENSPIGTTVLSSQDRRPIVFKVTDPDLAPHDEKPHYSYELTSSSFRVTEDGVLVVNEDHLDRDSPSPSQLSFQIIGRETGYGFSSSTSPLVLQIKLEDENDNAPYIAPIGPLVVPGGDGKRPIAKVQATDKDEGQNAVIKFSIHHVSNNGRSKFSIDPTTGLLESVGKLNSGETYSVTVQATDGGGRSFQSIVEVKVVDGENLKPPLFDQFAYDVSVSEGASIGSEVMTLEARDPEGKAVIYEIIGGNDLEHFTIGKNTGIITVNSKLDREDLSRYSLMVKAEDEGKLFSVVQVNVKILDNDDNNPIIIGTPYEFHVKEGLKDFVLGKIEAKDMDEGENAEIRFEIPPNVPFNIHPISGEFSTKLGLDYEKEKTHHVVVTARGIGKESRISTATVTVHVEDHGDEMPVFRQFTYEVSVRENSPDLKIAQVEAFDPDTTEKSITYYIKQGPFDKFSIDPANGIIYATHRLDYEEASRHILIIGTEENDSGNLGSTTTVIINVIDENDIPPIFSVVPRPIRLEDTAKIGFVITTIQATDSDGTSPGNKVKYELIGRGKSYRYFEIHPDTGVISIKDDLRKEMDTEYQLDIRAYDLGEPSLDQVATVKVYVDHVATLPPDQGVGFADTEYTVEILENSGAGKEIKTLTIVNKPNELIPISCEIRTGNEEKIFEISTNKDRNCVLSLARATLDHERVKLYEIQIHLITLPGVISKKRSYSNVKVKILDENDNKPVFIFPEHQKVSVGKKLYGAISEDAQISTFVTQVQVMSRRDNKIFCLDFTKFLRFFLSKAHDKDSGRNGELVYSLESENPLSTDYFLINSKSGMITTGRTLSTISPSLLPFRLLVNAKDSPGSHSDSLASKIQLVINIISSPHRIVVVVEGLPPDRVKVRERDIVEIIQEFSNLIIGIEKITPHHFYHSNGTVDTDYGATDVWFYAVDPVSDHILDRESTKVAESILSNEGSKSISYFISSKLSVRVREIRKPLVKAPLLPAPVGPLQAEQKWGAFPSGLVGLSALILIIVLISISVVCYKWSKYTAYKNQVERYGGDGGQRYEPFYVESSTNKSTSLKQYETQILKMRVNGDEEESCSDLHVDVNSGRNHHNYSTPDSSSEPSPRRVIINESNLNYAHIGSIRTPILRTFQQQQQLVSIEHDPSISNPLYERSDDDYSSNTLVGGGSIINSEINENVHFQQPIRDIYSVGQLRRTVL